MKSGSAAESCKSSINFSSVWLSIQPYIIQQELLGALENLVLIVGKFGKKDLFLGEKYKRLNNLH